MKRLRFLFLWFMAFCMGVVSAQSASCPDIVTQALEAVENYCVDLGRNQACYGNIQLSVEAQANAEDFTFETTGDIADVADILSLDLNPLDENTGDWGVAVMSLQADIPDTLPGQNVTFILFGDVEIENAAVEGQSPMQAFYLRTGIGDSACEEAPDSGLLVQTPDGIDEVSFNVNGVDVQVGSTVLFQTEEISEDEAELVISTVEGTAIVNFDEEAYPAIAGTRIRMPINRELLPTGRPNLPESYEEARVRALPLAPLPRQIGIEPPLPPENLEDLRGRIQNGQPPCGVSGLPACENLPRILRDGLHLPASGNWGQRFQEGQNCIVRPETTVDAANLPPVIGETRAFPFCPPQTRAERPAPENRPRELDESADDDGDGVLNVDDVCPFEAGSAANQGCAQAPRDSDGDGILDNFDFCPNRAGTRENRGCPDAPRDSDSDGIPDALDQCPNRAGTSEFRGCPNPDSDGDGFNDNVDNCPNVRGQDNGCPRDSDGDGVPDALDQCVNQAGTAARNGCPEPVDSDGDGFNDNVDNCPNVRGQDNGCPRDSDGDGFPDAVDQCPNNAGSNNGCPPPPDSDGDGFADNVDNCPNVRGQDNGCPRDSDGDGFPDVVDQCPNNAGSNNGCPPPPDGDGDGIPDGQDHCPNKAGPASAGGCPDGDGDGVPNAVDQCPNQVGIPERYGCP